MSSPLIWLKRMCSGSWTDWLVSWPAVEALLPGGLEHAEVAAAGHRGDHVGPLGVLLQGQLLRPGHILKGVGPVDQELRLGVDRLQAHLNSLGPALEEGNLHGPDHAHDVGLGHEPHRGAQQEGGLVLLEGDGAHVGHVDGGVEDGELLIRELGRHLLQRLGGLKAGGEDQVPLLLSGHGPQVLLDRAPVLGLDDLRLDAELRLGPLHALDGHLVEWVEADLVGQHDHDPHRLGPGLRGGRGLVAEGRGLLGLRCRGSCRSLRTGCRRSRPARGRPARGQPRI